MPILSGIHEFDGFINIPEEDEIPPDGTVPVPPATPTPVEPPDDDDGGFFGFIDGLDDFIGDLSDALGERISGLADQLDAFQDDVDSSISGVIDDVSDGISNAADFTVNRLTENIDGVATAVFREADRLQNKIGDGIDAAEEFLDTQIDSAEQSIISGIDTGIDFLDDGLSQVSTKIEGGIDDVLAEIEDGVQPLIRKSQSAIEGQIDTLEAKVAGPLSFLQENLPLQVLNLSEVLEKGLGPLDALPGALGGVLTGIVTEVLPALGFDQLLPVFSLFGKIIGHLDATLPGDGSLDIQTGSWDMPRGTEDQINITLSSLPIIGQIIQTHHSAEFDRMRFEALEFYRPTPLDQGSIMESLRRRKDGRPELLDDLKKFGLSDDRIRRLEEIVNSPLPILERLDAWKRGFITDEGIVEALAENGLSDADIGIATQLASRLPPIQDQILFAIRGVFDVEESRKFGEFEGLPSSLESEFITKFGIEGGDFSKQVEVFANEAGKLGLPPEWVAAYWTSHWRLPSLQAAYEMFHRLAPDIVEAESADFVANGFNPAEIVFGPEELNRLVRSADFSSFWRPKLEAIAYNPLTRVDIRRMHKLGTMDDAATERAYRKVGFSPSDAAKMLEFTIAFNKTPDTGQADEIRSLTKAQILDFVENDLFTPAEGVETLIDIGYDQFAAEGFVELELAKRDRKAQRVGIDLIEERVLNGLIDVNDAASELDALGVGPAHKALVLRELDVALAKRTRQPTRAELDKFLEEQVIDTDVYETAMLSLGYQPEWVARFIQLNQPG